jgi:hypothetical protein
MRINWTGCVIAGLTLWVLASPAAAQVPFQWRGHLAAGQTIEIKGINGEVRATASPSADVEVAAIRTAKRSNPDEVRIEVVPHAGGITICAVYPTPPGSEPNRCEPGSQGRSNSRDNDTVVNFDVRVPGGVGFVGRTVNGAVTGESLQGDAEAHTVNGSVRLSTSGRALASTVNGSVSATMGRADWPNSATFTTVNGSITLTLPSAFDADLLRRDAERAISPRIPSECDQQHRECRASGIRVDSAGTIGNGGRELELTTVNGGTSGTQGALNPADL